MRFSLVVVSMGLVLFLFGGVVAYSILSPKPEYPQDRLIPVSLNGQAPLALSVVGTSLTAGYSWPDDLGQSLAKELGRKVTVSRVARPGAASDWATSQVAAVVAQAPDILFIEFSVNDADLRSFISVARSVENHRILIRELRASLPDSRIILLTMNPVQGVRMILRPRLARYYVAYHDLSHELDLGLVDLYPRWLIWEQAFPDGLHPSNTAASELIVPAVMSYFQQVVVNEKQ